jgi:hypothetical protein
LPGALDFGRPHRRLAPATSTQRLRLGKSGVGALQGQLALKLRDGCEDVKHEPPTGAGSVDRLGEYTKADLALGKIFGRLHELPDGAREPIELPNRQRVAGTKVTSAAFNSGRSRCAHRTPSP